MAEAEAIVFVVFVTAYTLAATWWDQVYWKIPNKLTLPMFFAGWVYQGVFDQWAGLATGGLGFLVGFGILFLLWMVGTAGGGDVKLLTALALWIAPLQFGQLIVLMALLGGLLTLVFGAWHIMRRRKDRLAIPYGVAISAAGLWVLAAHYLPAAGQAIGITA